MASHTVLHTRARRATPAGRSAVLTAGLLAAAAAGWWWSARPHEGMGGTGGMAHVMSLTGFAVAWTAMMAAMMLPAALPAVRLYALGAARGRLAPVPWFVLGYLALWAVMALPAYPAWRALATPLAEGRAWTGSLAGAALLLAAAWQLTPLKTACLRQCRSPLGLFLRHGRQAHRPLGALGLGLRHGAFCLGCCWALFAALVALGTMHLLWMAVLTAVVVLEKAAPRGEALARAAAVALAVLGLALLAHPSSVVHIT